MSLIHASSPVPGLPIQTQERPARYPHKLAAAFFSVGLGVGLSVIPGQMAQAANNISLEYGPIQRSLPYSDLQTFADTSKPTGLLADLIAFSKQDPEKVHKLLTTSIPIKVTTMDRIVNSYIGEVILGQVGQIILPISGGEPVKALKAALVSGVKNDQITALSFIQSYPVDMRVNGQRMLAIKKQLDEDSKYLPEIVSGLQGIASKFLPGLSGGAGTPGGSSSPTPSPSVTPTPAP